MRQVGEDSRSFDEIFRQAQNLALHGDEASRKDKEVAPPHIEAKASARDDKKDRDLDRNLRRCYGYAFLWSAVGWLIFVALMVISSGLASLCGRRFLSDAVLMAIVSSASLMGLLAIILRHLFFRNK